MLFAGVFRVYKIETLATKGLKANFQTSFSAHLCELSDATNSFLTFTIQYVVIILAHSQLTNMF